jgi:hypothetical protein
MIFRNILIFLLLTTPVFAADNPRMISYPPQKIMGFRGLDTSSKAPLLQDGRAIAIQNVKLSTAFDLTKRFGINTINDETLDDLDLSSPAITGLFGAEFADGTAWPIAFVGNKIKYDAGTVENSVDWTEIGNSWTAPTITADQDNTFQCIMALNTVVCTNDVDVPIEISSTPAKSALDVSDLSDTLTKAKTVAWFRNYLIFANTVENSVEKPTRFRWSNVGTTETWTDDDFNDLAEFGGNEITGLVELYGNLYIFLKRAIYKVTLVGGDDVFNFDKVVDNVGAISRDSIQLVRLPNNQFGIIFLDERKKVYLFTGLIAQDIGEIIQPTLDALSAGRLDDAVSSYDGESYYLSVSNGSAATNDLLLEYQVEIGEWTKHTDINANAMAQVVDSSVKKTYFGNYNAFVYWMGDPDKKNDVDGASGIVDSTGLANTSTITGAQVIIDAELTSGIYTGATIKITSGTAADEEKLIVDFTSTSLIVETAFSTTPDSTSNYSIGAIDAQYQTKWYDMGDSPRKKVFKDFYFWSKEQSNSQVTINQSQDYGSIIDSETISLSPSASSLWDTAIWDTATWGTAGDKMKKFKLKGQARVISFTFSNSSIDETFSIYGYNILADALDIR